MTEAVLVIVCQLRNCIGYCCSLPQFTEKIPLDAAAAFTRPETNALVLCSVSERLLILDKTPQKPKAVAQ